jgi:hypothetical protein
MTFFYSVNKHDINGSYWIDLIGYKYVYAKAGATLTRAKSGRISFLDVLSAVPPFSEGLLEVYNRTRGTWQFSPSIA